jgi:hypothetical protein
MDTALRVTLVEVPTYIPPDVLELIVAPLTDAVVPPYRINPH